MGGRRAPRLSIQLAAKRLPFEAGCSACSSPRTLHKAAHKQFLKAIHSPPTTSINQPEQRLALQVVRVAHTDVCGHHCRGGRQVAGWVQCKWKRMRVLPSSCHPIQTTCLPCLSALARTFHRHLGAPPRAAVHPAIACGHMLVGCCTVGRRARLDIRQTWSRQQAECTLAPWPAGQASSSSSHQTGRLTSAAQHAAQHQPLHKANPAGDWQHAVV